MTEKVSNPKQAYGDMKVGVSSVPMAFLYGVAVAMAEGGMKYGRHNYRDTGCKHSTYFDAAVGHLVSWWEGEDIDEESGVHHLLKAAASIAVMYDSIVMKNDNDDRPIRYPTGVPLRINDAIAKLKEKYPNPKEPFTQRSVIEAQMRQNGAEEMIDRLREQFEEQYLEAAGRRDGFRPICDECPVQDICRLEDSELHCSDCKYHVPRGMACLKGKLLLQRDPKVGDCPYFERKNDGSNEQD